MEDHLPFLRALPLFSDMDDEDILRVLECFHARAYRFDRARTFWDISGQPPFWGIIVEGSLMAQQEDWRGNRSIVGDFGPGGLLEGSADGAMAGLLPFFFSVRAGTLLIVLDHAATVNPCESCCRAHLLFLRNAARALAYGQKLLLHRIEYLSKRTTREKIISYLTIQSAIQGARRFNIPYTRQELADFLAVDRSAMCTELTRMQNDGLLRYERKRFELLDEVKDE